MPIEVNVMELDAARALLQLHRTPRQEMGMEEAVALFLSCLNTGTKQHPAADSQSIALQCDKETQTAKDMQTKSLPGFQRMAELICGLSAKINCLEHKINTKESLVLPSSTDELDPDVYTDLIKIQQYDQGSSGSHNTANIYGNLHMKRKAEAEWKSENCRPCKQIKKSLLQPMDNSNDLVPIGHGYASVPARVLKQIDWSSYTCATRKLLDAVFSRRDLATHSLTGKSSPAFPDKPAKKRLDPKLVDDIVQVVVERCSVPASNVRNIITYKCADETKMYRNRQMNETKRQSIKMDQENISPSPCGNL